MYANEFPYEKFLEEKKEYMYYPGGGLFIGNQNYVHG